jgi:RNA polymerase sigma-70 factor (ECF subfamily)
VSHNAAASYVARRRRRFDKNLVDLESVEIAAEAPEAGTAVDEARMLARIRELVQRLKPLDREVFVLYLEGLSMQEIAEIAGLSQVNTRTKLHRIRAVLAARLGIGESA